jgi:hypothetical protein
LGKNIVDSSGDGWNDEGSQEEASPVTLCIAAPCRGKTGDDEDHAAIVLCCDECGDRGLVSADDSYKIRWVGNGISVMLAGARTRAQELYLSVMPCLEAYDAETNPDDLWIDKLLQDLKACVDERKKGSAQESD